MPENGSGSDSNNAPKRPESRPANWMKFAGLGMELASLTLGTAAIGYGVDWYFQSDRKIGVAFGLLIGFSFGMFRFLKVASRSGNGH